MENETREQEAERYEKQARRYKEREEMMRRREAEKQRIAAAKAAVRRYKWRHVAAAGRFLKRGAHYVGRGIGAAAGATYGGVKRGYTTLKPKRRLPAVLKKYQFRRGGARRYYYPVPAYTRPYYPRRKRKRRQTSGDYNPWDFTSGFKLAGF